MGPKVQGKVLRLPVPIISPAHATKTVVSDTEKVKKNVTCTLSKKDNGVNTKESLITNYFKPIDKAKHQQQNQHILKILQLEAKCNKLKGGQVCTL